ncbi:hypothetical protein [Vibrio neptunius]|uniref:hypothetical protein n=1 Tax=Vibrio neptunius TaxID=170651 RepID=UPI0019D0E7D6|nr:hypothetical protein [Vibrio neptunius]MBN3573575.1 hypothetical protein [Vibrio neptunius]
MSIFDVVDFDLIVVFSSLLLLSFGYWKGRKLRKNKPNSNIIASVPSLLTSGGVLFTFLGIAIGLMDFNPNDLNNSISTLLGGLKLAFWSSIFGMLLSMLFKIVEIPHHQKALSQVTPDDMQNVLRSQLIESEKTNSQAKTQHQDNQKLLKELISEISLLRSTTSASNLKSQESFDGLSNEINQFASNVSSQASKQIAESLKHSIEGFNQGLMGQFGANFQRLDESVLKMLKWQQQYKVQIEQLTNAFEYAVESVVATEQSLGVISSHTKAIPDAMDQLSDTTDIWNKQITDLDQRLAAFSTMRDKAVQAMPEIQRQLDELCQQVDQSILNTCRNLEEGVLKASSELQDKALALSEKLVEATDGIGGDLSDASGQIESMTSHLATSSDKIKQTLDDSIGQLDSRLNSLVNGIRDDVANISKTLSNVNDGLIDKHREQLDKNSELLEKAHYSIDKKVEDTINQQMKRSLQVQDTIKHHLIESSSVFQQDIKLVLEDILSHMGKGLFDITDEFARAAQRLNTELHNIQSKEAIEEVS